MSEATAPQAPLLGRGESLRYSTYLDAKQMPFSFCPGCGHSLILRQLDAALVKLQLDPQKVIIVSDIGCSGLSDRFFATNAFHGLHGRSVTYATGIKLANPDLKVIVIMGDGGCGIGGHHLISAARRNIGLTVLVMNNLNFGMTGGEHSVTTPTGAITATTWQGNLERPLDIASTVAANGASWVARTTAFEKSLADLLAEAIGNEGFSLLDVWELCTAYYTNSNRFTRRDLEVAVAQMSGGVGIIHREAREEYSRAYRQASAGGRSRSAVAPNPLVAKYTHSLQGRLGCVFAGAAGAKIVSTASAFARGGVLSGLWATQHSDYPVTVRSGYSKSEVVLSPDEIYYPGIATPNMILLLYKEGLTPVVRAQLARMDQRDVVYVDSDLLPISSDARVVALDFARATINVTRENKAMMAVAELLRHEAVYPLEALLEAVRVGQRPEIAAQNVAAIEGGAGLNQ
jgi:pyruvate/2-oxoacid:ferredoxin oxidoreductase beta subunit/Pyruvate/2-oxoacid:ferredoxin oxidoreductase gamma subunit